MTYLIKFYKNSKLVKTSRVVALNDTSAYQQAEAIAVRVIADEWFIDKE